MRRIHFEPIELFSIDELDEDVREQVISDDMENWLSQGEPCTYEDTLSCFRKIGEQFNAEGERIFFISYEEGAEVRLNDTYLTISKVE
jgi:hypothetical protein